MISKKIIFFLVTLINIFFILLSLYYSLNINVINIVVELLCFIKILVFSLFNPIWISTFNVNFFFYNYTFLFLTNYLNIFFETITYLINGISLVISSNIFFLCVSYYSVVLLSIYLVIKFSALTFTNFNKLMNYTHPILINLMYIIFK